MSEDRDTDATGEMTSTLQVHSRWATGADFLAEAEREGEELRFFHPVDPPPEVATGNLITAELHFEDRNVTFRLHATVREVLRHAPKIGLLLETLPQEADRRELVLLAAEGESVPYFRRRHDRFACELPVKVSTGLFRKRTLRAVDISAGGMRLAGRPLFAAGTAVNVQIDFPEAEVLKVEATVIGTIGFGPQMGTCLEFQFESSQSRQALEQAVQVLSDRD